MNTTAPNRDYYKPALLAAAYARNVGLIRDDNELAYVVGVIEGQYAPPAI